MSQSFCHVGRGVGRHERLDVGLVPRVVVDHHPVVARLLQRVEDGRLREEKPLGLLSLVLRRPVRKNLAVLICASEKSKSAQR